MFASDLDNQWSRFPLNPSFVPFTVETARYLTEAGAGLRSWTLPDVPAGAPDAPGVVTVGTGGAAHQVAVNVDPRESSPAVTSVEEFTADIGRVSRTARREAAGDAREVEGRQRWWQIGLLVMLAALAGEAVVGRRAI